MATQYGPKIQTGRFLWPDCPAHRGQFKRARTVNGVRWVYCQGEGWHVEHGYWGHR